MTTDPTSGIATEDGDELRPPVQWLDDASAPVDPSAWRDVEADSDDPALPPLAAEAIDEHEPPARGIKLVPRSLAGRLVTGVVALVVVLVLATGIGTYYALRSFLYDRLDQQVGQVADANLASIEECVRIPAPCNVGGASTGIAAPQRTWLAVYRSSGALAATVQSGAVLEPMKLSQSEIQTILRHPTTVRSVSTPDGRLRVVGRVLPGTSGSIIVVSGLSAEEVNRTLGRLFALELAIGGSAVLLALVATSYGVRFSLRRLYRVTDTARDVAAELSPDGAGLDRRVPVTEPDSEVGQLAESMNTLLAAVETQFAARLANERRMRQFLADASHELRTPLTSIRGYAELARMQRVQGEAEDNLARIEAEGTRMSRLVDDLLTLARSDQGGEPISEIVDFGALAEDGVAGVRAAFPERQIELSAPVGLDVLGDPDRLLRVVINLATNAAVHTRPDGAIRVTVSWDGPYAVLRVVDDGPGLPPEEAAHVFERFWRADKARTRASGGSGLGMAIVAAVVADHDGTVTFDSTVSGGSTVTVRLPRSTP